MEGNSGLGATAVWGGGNTGDGVNRGGGVSTSKNRSSHHEIELKQS